MELNGTRTIAAPRELVWAKLNDPETLKACIPGCEELTGSPGEGFEATVKQKVGPVKATFKGAVTLEDVNAPESYRIVGEGKGGVAGFAKGAADVTLAEVPEGTELTYAVEAKVGGKLAQLGSRIVGGFAAKMADQFFETFKNQVEDGAPRAQDPVT
ncbi:CoxG family protein [Jannaschia formosa]|uniref:CoxG family protein n=1 Tax=Jannaschia formosa TaxID=2259592 RepID=UPI000E1C31FB|nr:carbon monoxide dehydrogenase subunit G [Jannaschia formosa]TFL16694.1 carbon monoxide dehydrogenase [Jannaschia formosa]